MGKYNDIPYREQRYLFGYLDGLLDFRTFCFGLCQPFLLGSFSPVSHTRYPRALQSQFLQIAPELITEFRVL